MKQIETVHDDEEGEVKAENDWGWWMVLPVMALGLLVFQISASVMKSVFDEKDD